MNKDVITPQRHKLVQYFESRIVTLKYSEVGIEFKSSVHMWTNKNESKFMFV